MANVLNELEIYQKHCKSKIHATKSSYFTHCVYCIKQKESLIACRESIPFYPNEQKKQCRSGSRIEKKKKSSNQSGSLYSGCS